MNRYLCGTPESHCKGGITQFGRNWRGPRKSHITRLEAFNCHARYLRSVGFEQMSQNEFTNPETGYVRLLSRPSRFGCRIRPGKEGRHMPAERTGGLIICT